MEMWSRFCALVVALGSVVILPLSSADAAEGLKLPWAGGVSWNVTQGMHTTRSWDFQPPGAGSHNDQVLAVAAGTARVTCSDGANQAIVSLATAYGTFRYAHLQTSASSAVGITAVGVQVQQGQVIGRLHPSPPGSDSGCGYAIPAGASHLHLEFPTVPLSMDGVTFSATGPSSGSYVSTNTQEPTTPPGSANGGNALRGAASDRCVDAVNAGTSNGTQVQLYDCNGTAAQQWAYVNGQLMVYGNSPKCLDADAGSIGANGTKVQIWDCLGGSNQQWWATATGALVNAASGRCLDATDGSTASGTRLQLFDCNQTGAQQWFGGPVPNGSPAVRNPGSGRCLDVANGSISSRTPVQLWDCNESAAQQWSADNHQLRVYQNKCLDITDANFADGTALQIYECDGNPAQAWVFHADGSIRNPASGKCADLRDGGAANGTRLQLWTCNGTAAQQFHQPLPPPAPRAVMAAGGVASATLTWEAGSASSAPQATAFRITASSGGISQIVGSNARSAEVTGLVPGSAYSFRVTAINPFGESPASAPSNTVTPTGESATPSTSPTPIPTGVTSDLPGRTRAPRVSVRGNRVVVRWQQPTANGALVVGYVVDISRGRDKILGAKARRTVFKRLKPGRYKIRVASRSAAGTAPFSGWTKIRVR
jgi:hypothetical protein